jgi:hypothetical protein
MAESVVFVLLEQLLNANFEDLSWYDLLRTAKNLAKYYVPLRSSRR